jgi:hypothetical protein
MTVPVELALAPRGPTLLARPVIYPWLHRPNHLKHRLASSSSVQCANALSRADAARGMRVTDGAAVSVTSRVLRAVSAFERC